MQNVVLLSGGEKALTAMSLLMAIFKYQPSPFCVLDEANIGRFTKLLAEMATGMQFIVMRRGGGGVGDHLDAVRGEGADVPAPLAVGGDEPTNGRGNGLGSCRVTPEQDNPSLFETFAPLAGRVAGTGTAAGGTAGK